jgi:hypothetical protein
MILVDPNPHKTNVDPKHEGGGVSLAPGLLNFVLVTEPMRLRGTNLIETNSEFPSAMSRAVNGEMYI